MKQHHFQIQLFFSCPTDPMDPSKSKIRHLDRLFVFVYFLFSRSNPGFSISNEATSFPNSTLFFLSNRSNGSIEIQNKAFGSPVCYCVLYFFPFKSGILDFK